MDYILLLKILVEWSVESKEYELLKFIYTGFNIGLPNRFLYRLPDHNIFYSLSSFNSKNDLKKIEDENLEQLFYMFKRSKYTRLEYWEDSYGYKIIN